VIGMIPQEGDEFLLTPEDLSKFREMAPASAIKAVSQAIYHLQNSANVGYEQMVQDLDFLSRP